MQAFEVMTREVVTVSPQASIEAIVRLLMAHRVSALPVIDGERRVLGIVSEADLIRRPAIAGEHGPSWWQSVLSGPSGQARDFIRRHGRSAAQIMTRNVVTVGPMATLGWVVELMQSHRIRRTPVVDKGRLVGIVSRSDLLRALLLPCQAADAPAPDDGAIQAQLLQLLSAEGWDTPALNVSVEDGVVRLWGCIESAAVRQAVRVAAWQVPGVKQVDARFSHVYRPALGWA